jgi:hypothetical protein
MSKKMQEKLEIIKEAKKVFGRSGVRFDVDEIVSKLTIDEVLDSFFEKQLLPNLTEDTTTPSPQLFTSFMESYSHGRNVKSVFKEEEDIKRIIDKYITLSADCDRVSIQENALLKDNEEYFISQVFKNNSLNIFLKNNPDQIRKFLDSTMTKSDFETISRLLEYLTSNKFNYSGYPLVILNKNLDQSKKIEIIKTTYVQKDLNKYTEFMKKNIVDLNDLDSFIEATIIQNNRVKEKEKGVIELMKRIFIGMRGDYHSLDLTKYENKEVFFGKYKKYFTPGVVKMLTDDSVTYNSRGNAVNLITRMFKNGTFEEKIEIAKHSDRIGDALFQDIDKVPSDVKDIPLREASFFEYILKRYSFSNFYKKFGHDASVSYISKYKDSFKGYITKSFKINDKPGYWSETKSEDMIKLFLSLGKEIVEDEKFSFIPEGSDEVKTLGLKGQGERYSNNSSYLFNHVSITLGNVSTLLSNSNCSDYLKAKIYKEFFSQYEDEEFVNSDLLDRASRILSNGDFIGEIKGRFQGSMSINKDSDIFKVLFIPTLDVVLKFFPDKHGKIKENLDRLETNLRVIINI